MSTLAILASHEDGDAYDKLVALGTSTDPDIRSISISTQNEVYLQMTQTLRTSRSFTTLQTNDQMIALLNDPNPLTRQAAIEGLVNQRDNTIVPKLLDMAEHDPALFVRRDAYFGLQGLTGQTIEPLQLGKWKNWWQQNKDHWPQ